jgi:hypothetical protein
MRHQFAVQENEWAKKWPSYTHDRGKIKIYVCCSEESIVIQTPLNNNIRELFNLMNFLDPENWNNLDALQKEYAKLTEDLVKQLHNLLRPYFLRRVKSEVLQLPPKVGATWHNTSCSLNVARMKSSFPCPWLPCSEKSIGQFSVSLIYGNVNYHLPYWR